MSAMLAMHDVTSHILIAHTAEKRREENEMRLIDADALIEFCAERWIPLNVDAVNMQPTIQPVATDTNVGDTISRQAAIDAEDDKWN